MKEIPLTRGMVTLIDDADYEFLSQWDWQAHKSNVKWYAKRTSRKGGNFRHHFLHRELVNAPPSLQVDHRDGDGLNNQRSNIRACTRTQNAANRRKRKSSSSQFKGVWWDKNTQKWHSSIIAGGKRRYLGGFVDEREAAMAYDAAAFELNGEFARLNFPGAASRLTPEGEGQ